MENMADRKSIVFNECLVSQWKAVMLIEVHYGNDSMLLVNGNCRGIHILDYIRSRCDVSPSIPIDLCLINSGEPVHLSSFDSKMAFEKSDYPSYLRCVLTRIDDQGTYIPLLKNSQLITNDFLAKLNKSSTPKHSTTTKSSAKPVKQSSTTSKPITIRRRRSLKSIAIAAAFVQGSPTLK